jgi:hypothetical protein
MPNKRVQIWPLFTQFALGFLLSLAAYWNGATEVRRSGIACVLGLGLAMGGLLLRRWWFAAGVAVGQVTLFAWSVLLVILSIAGDN